MEKDNFFYFIFICFKTFFIACKYKKGDYSFIDDCYERMQYKEDFHAVDLIGKNAWLALKERKVDSIMYEKINKKMYDHMSDISRKISIEQLVFIARNGWFIYVYLTLLYQDNRRLSYV